MQSKNINDVFDDLLFAEEIAQKKGYEEGYLVGKKELFEGYHLGYHKASAVSSQLGFFNGILEGYLLTHHENVSSKIKILAEQIIQDIKQFPQENSIANRNENFQDIKSKYLMFCSLSKIHVVHAQTNKLDF